MKKRRRVTEQEVQKILAYRKDGMGTTEIANKVQRARSLVHKILSTHGRLSPPKNVPLAASPTVQMQPIGTSLEQATADALARGTRELVELLAREAPEIDAITVDLRAGTIKAVVRRAIDFKL